MPSDRPPLLEIKDWKRHQHYNDARPPWIKLYGALLDDAGFLGLPDAAQLQLIKLWLLASRMGHPLPNDPRLLAGKIGCRGKFNLSAILAAGFVKEVSRESLDKSYTDPTPLSTENRELQQPSSSAPVWKPGLEARTAARLASDNDRVALTAILAKSESKSAVVAEIGMVLDGGRPNVSRDPAHVGLALCDYAANESRWNNALFRSYVQRAARGERQGKPRGGTGQRSYDNAVNALRDL